MDLARIVTFCERELLWLGPSGAMMLRFLERMARVFARWWSRRTVRKPDFLAPACDCVN